MTPPLDDFNGWADFWRYNIGVNVIPAVGWTKKPIVDWKEWQNNPIPESLHNQWKDENKFNQGMAIITGNVWHRKDKQGYYLVAGDGDNEVARKEITNDLSAFAHNTLVEQNEDVPDKFHWLLYSCRPIINKDPDIKRDDIPLIEIKCLRRILYCSPCRNARGNPKNIIGTPEPNILESFEKTDEFERKINDICTKYGLKYLDKDDRYDKPPGAPIELDTNKIESIVEIIRPYYVEGAKDNIIFGLSGFLYKINVGIDSTIALVELLSDNERKAISTAEATYKKKPDQVIGYRRLIEILSAVLDKEVAQRIIDEISGIIGAPNRRDDYYAKIPELQGSIFYEIGHNPTKFIIADNQSKHLVEATLHTHTKKDDDGKLIEGAVVYTLTQNKTFVICIPTKVIRHKNPLTYLELQSKYTITFVDAIGEENTFSHKTLSEIVNGLRELGYVYNSDGSEGALGVIMHAYQSRHLIEDNEEIDFTGFFSVGSGSNQKIIASNLEIKEPSIVDLEDSLKFIEQLADYYKGRLDLLATLIVWGSIAPTIFMLKENNYFLKWLHFYGFPNATKSNSGKIVLALDRHHNDYKFLLSIGRIDTIARLGDMLSNSTFPKLVDEADLNGKEKEWLVNALKSAIEGKVARSKFMSNRSTTSTMIPALSPLILTSNGPPPSDSGYMRRVIDRNFGKSESMDENAEIPKRFKELLRTDLCRLGHYGDFRNWYIMNNQSIILNESRPLPLGLGYGIVKEAYKRTGRKMPEWFDKTLSEGQLEESLQDSNVIVKRAFESYIDKCFKESLQFFRMQEPSIKDGDGWISPKQPDSVSERFVKLVKNNLLADIKRSPKTFGCIIRKGLLDELYRFGVTKDQLPNLKALADYMGAEYKKSMGYKIVLVDDATLTAYFDEMEDLNE